MQIKQTFDGWQVLNATERCIALFENKQDAELFVATRNMIQKANKAQYAYYDNEPIERNMPRATALLHAMIEEAIEALQEIPNRKHWQKYSYRNRPIDYDAYFNELADIQIFLLAIVLWSGMPLNTFYTQLVTDKLSYNEYRQDHRQTEID